MNGKGGNIKELTFDIFAAMSSEPSAFLDKSVSASKSRQGHAKISVMSIKSSKSINFTKKVDSELLLSSEHLGESSDNNNPAE